MNLALIRLMRPKQWIKNLIVFAGVVFSGRLLDIGHFLRAAMAFGTFCAISSSVYIINDLVDIDRDRLHPVKCHRPLPSGEISRRYAIGLSCLLTTAAVLGAYHLSVPFTVVLVTYFVLMIAYSCYLKHLVLVDVFVIALGFVLRAYGGTLVAQVPISPWLLICTILLSLFLGFSKRRNEIAVLAHSAANHRSNLGEYTLDLLNQLVSIVTAATIIAYSIYTFMASEKPYLMFTIPLVMYGIFRYLYLTNCKNLGGSPEQALFADNPLLVTVGLWGATVVYLLYFHQA